MNSRALEFTPQKSYSSFIKGFFCLPCLFAILIFATGVSAQTKKWRCVTTAGNGMKAFFNEDIKVLAGGNKSVWEKLIMTDGSSAIVLAE